MISALYGTCAIVGAAVFLYTYRLQRRAPDRPRLAMCIAFGAFTIGVTFAIPAVADAINSLLVANTAKVISHGCLMVVVGGAQTMLCYLALPAQQASARVRGWMVTIGTAYGAMLILFALTFTLHEPVELTVEYATQPLVAAYLLIYIAVFFAYAVSLARLSLRFAAVTKRVWLRRGMRALALGSGLSLLYVSNKAVFLTAYALGYQPHGEAEIAAVLVTVASLPMLLGLTMPAWGPLIDAVPKLVSYRRLRPLWRDLIDEFPDLELDSALRRPGRFLRDVDFALTRRVSEIRDGRLALLRYIDSRVTDAALTASMHRRLSDRDRQAAVEAAQLAYGIRAHRAGRVADSPQPGDDFYRPSGQPEEVAWLAAVARAYARSPIVQAALAATETQLAGTGLDEGLSREEPIQ